MPSIVEYDLVLRRMAAVGLECKYFNSGAFGFGRGVMTSYIGWVGPPDASIRPAAMEHVRRVAEPFEPNLARLAARAWLELFPGPVWVMPKSQWGYELDFGSKAWLPDALRRAGIDPAKLSARTDSPAIELMPDEADHFSAFTETLLANLIGSDFALGFPDHPVACSLHHHKQIWWVSNDAKIIEAIDSLRQ